MVGCPDKFRVIGPVKGLPTNDGPTKTYDQTYVLYVVYPKPYEETYLSNARRQCFSFKAQRLQQASASH
jgi:hypothetical protein